MKLNTSDKKGDNALLLSGRPHIIIWWDLQSSHSQGQGTYIFRMRSMTMAKEGPLSPVVDFIYHLWASRA